MINYYKAKNTGIGSLSIGENYTGRKHIKFDENGDYPYGTYESIIQKINYLEQKINKINL